MLVAAFFLVLPGFCPERTDALTVDRIIATVNNEIVLLSDYERFAYKNNPGNKQDGIDDAVLRSLLEERIIYLEARRQGFDASEEEIRQSIEEFQRQNSLSSLEFERRLSEEGMSLHDYRNLLRENIISLKLIKKEVDAKVAVSDKDIARYYNDNLQTFSKDPEKYEVKAIFLRIGERPTLTELTDLKIKSLKISDELKKGESFERMVSLYDDESLKQREGLLGEFEKGELLPELDRQLQQMQEAEVSSPLWTKEGVYILKLVKKNKGSYVPIEEVRNTIYETLYNKKRETLYNAWMTLLWSKASVKIKQQ